MFKIQLKTIAPKTVQEFNLTVIRHRLAQISLISSLARISGLELGFDLIPIIFSHAPYQMDYVADRLRGVLKLGTDKVLYRFDQKIEGEDIVIEESIHHVSLDQRKYRMIFQVIEKTFDTPPPNYAFDRIEEYFTKAGASVLLS